MIEIQNLSKKFGDVAALNNISIQADGGILGVCGPKGAGKSTLLGIIAGVLPFSEGEVSVFGAELPKDATTRCKLIGYLNENAPVFKEMTPCEFLMFVGEAKKIPYEKLFKQMNEVIELTELTDVKDTYIEHLSYGERKILGIAATLLGNPKIVVLDSPFLGLNARELSTIKAIIKMLGEIKTVVISSRNLAEIADVCSNVALLLDGELFAFGAPDEIPEIPAQTSSEEASEADAEEETEEVLDEEEAETETEKEGE